MIETSPRPLGEHVEPGPGRSMACWRQATGDHLRRILPSIVLLLVLELALLVAPQPGPVSAGGPAGPAPAFRSPTGETSPVTYTLTILQTNDTWGYLDPCG
jgi:hypothetical protein